MSEKKLVLIIEANQGYIPQTKDKEGFQVQNSILFSAITETYIPLLNMFCQLEKENIPVENLLILVDDLSLPLGTVRLKAKGSDGGHNGLKSIAGMIGTQAYPRLRFGIGNDFPKGCQVDYVLGEFSNDDKILLDERIKIAVDAIRSFCLAGLPLTMNQFNNK